MNACMELVGFSSPNKVKNHCLRANPFPEVTDPLCRLPLPTLFHRLEAVHLGDLMRISVRPGARITRSLGFSRAVGSAPDATTSVTLYRAQHPLSSQPDSRGPPVKKKREIFPGLPPTSPLEDQTIWNYLELPCLMTKGVGSVYVCSIALPASLS